MGRKAKDIIKVIIELDHEKHQIISLLALEERLSVKDYLEILAGKKVHDWRVSELSSKIFPTPLFEEPKATEEKKIETPALTPHPEPEQHAPKKSKK